MTAPRTSAFWKWLGRGICWAVVVYLVAPLPLIIGISFSSAQFLTFPPPGFSLQWYQKLFHDADWVASFLVSIEILLPTTIAATVLGTSASYALWRMPGRFPQAISILMLAPIAVPAIISGAAMFMLFRTLGLFGSLTSLIIAHIVLTTPYVFITVSTGLKTLDPRLPAVAAILGATPSATFRRVIAPLLAPAILSGALFAAVMSFDELVVSLFLSTPGLRPITVQMWSNVRADIDPTLAAVASVLFGFSFLALLLDSLLVRVRTRQKTGGA